MKEIEKLIQFAKDNDFRFNNKSIRKIQKLGGDIENFNLYMIDTTEQLYHFQIETLLQRKEFIEALTRGFINKNYKIEDEGGYEEGILDCVQFKDESNNYKLVADKSDKYIYDIIEESLYDDCDLIGSENSNIIIEIERYIYSEPTGQYEKLHIDEEMFENICDYMSFVISIAIRDNKLPEFINNLLGE